MPVVGRKSRVNTVKHYLSTCRKTCTRYREDILPITIMTAMSIRYGSCLCRQVRFTMAGDPFHHIICHCSNCKKASGSAFMANIFFKKDVRRSNLLLHLLYTTTYREWIWPTVKMWSSDMKIPIIRVDAPLVALFAATADRHCSFTQARKIQVTTSLSSHLECWTEVMIGVSRLVVKVVFVRTITPQSPKERTTCWFKVELVKGLYVW